MTPAAQRLSASQARLREQAIASRRAGLLLFGRGKPYDDEAMALLDAADAAWRALKAIQRVEKRDKSRATVKRGSAGEG